MKQSPKEHKFVAHCLAYLIGGLKGTKILNVSVKNKPETLQILKKDLRIIYKKNPDEIADALESVKDVINKPGKDGDIKVSLWKTITLTVEAKGTRQENTARDAYAIYTVLGQLLCLFKKFARHQWYAIACPAAWKKAIHEKLKGNPIADMIIGECKKRDQRLFFYFVHKNGRIEPHNWGSFLGTKLKDN